MSNYYSNPTANAAIGIVEKQMRQMKKKAKRLIRLRQQGLLTPEQEAMMRREFTGIFRRLPDMTLEELKK